MDTTFGTLVADKIFHECELSTELKDRERFKEQFDAVFASRPMNYSSLDSLLSCDLEIRSAAAQRRKTMLQVVFHMLVFVPVLNCTVTS